MIQSPTDEIDLQELAIRILRYFRKHFWFILLSSAIGSTVGFVGYNLLPPVFESDMVVKSDIMPASYSTRLTSSFQRLISERNDSTLALRLGLSLNDASSILAIRIESIKKEVGSKEGTTFVITAEVAKKALFPELQVGLVNYLRNIEFVKIRVRLREEGYRILIDYLTQEIKSLDSLRNRLSQGKPIYAKSSDVMLVDPTNIYALRLDMQKDLIAYKDSLELSNSIQLVEGFTPFRKPANPKLLTMLISGFSLGFLGVLGILIFGKLWKMAVRN